MMAGSKYKPEHLSALQRVREAAAKREMTFEQYLKYALVSTNDLTPDEQWDVMTVLAAFDKRDNS
jgi:hypothetical protein